MTSDPVSYLGRTVGKIKPSFFQVQAATTMSDHADSLRLEYRVV